METTSQDVWRMAYWLSSQTLSVEYVVINEGSKMRRIVESIIERCQQYGPDDVVHMSDILGIDRQRANELTHYMSEQMARVCCHTEYLADVVNQAETIEELLFVVYLFGRVVEKKELMGFVEQMLAGKE